MSLGRNPVLVNFLTAILGTLHAKDAVLCCLLLPLPKLRFPQFTQIHLSSALLLDVGKQTYSEHSCMFQVYFFNRVMLFLIRGRGASRQLSFYRVLPTSSQ